MKELSFIYFDVGGVALLDFSGTKKWDHMLKSIGVNDSNEKRFNEVWDKHKSSICIDYEVDSMTAELKDYVGLRLDDGFSLLAEFIKRFEPNPTIWPVIEYAKKHYKIGLLTDQYPRMLDEIFKVKGLMPKIQWDVIIDSSVVKMKKSDSEIFKLAQKLSKISNPREILFIDNSEHKLIHPKILGWRTLLYDPINPDRSNAQLMAEIQS